MSGSVGLIFDCDGVLLDSIGAWHSLDEQVAREAGIALGDDDREALNSSTLDEAAAYFHTRFGIGASPKAVEERFMNMLMNYYREEAAEVAGALRFVRTMREAGVKLCVLSSSPRQFLQLGLGHAGFLEFIDNVFSADDMPYKKRDARIYPHVCDLLGVDVERSWFFDDSEYALQTARDAGMRTVGVWSADQCGTHERLSQIGDLVCDSFLELPQEPSFWLA